MELLAAQSINLLGLALCIGAFFINNVTWLRIAALGGCIILFLCHRFDAIPTGNISNITLVLINAFYLFKVYTHGQLDLE
ncbi:hypothetical protein [Pseudoalteromonas tunicata]|uniref:hypothetical protein n=1 Tax=Pseudoalteromonas tunicata TaxID=314281 RepID=UPI00273E5430|nr:hypothetical protein [Pseudoalteromonas tunicata]MDP4985733.1 hypothetical protein [Pseudoalteromonas tunicata]MDP5213015.1 hypothetical protein [Pseudoalteromonas tunicata]